MFLEKVHFCELVAEPNGPPSAPYPPRPACGPVTGQALGPPGPRPGKNLLRNKMRVWTQRDFLIKKGIEYRDTVSMNKLSINMIPELCNSAGLTKVDLISIDIEFCNILPDLKCLLDAFRPRLLMLEHISKSLDIHNFSDSEESYYLGKAGYKIVNIIINGINLGQTFHNQFQALAIEKNENIYSIISEWKSDAFVDEQ